MKITIYQLFSKMLFSIIICGCVTNRIESATPRESRQIVPSPGFGAYYTKINSGEDFEKYSRTGAFGDIVVNLGDKKGRLVFWRGSSFLPYLETRNGRWYVDEIVKRKGNGTVKRPDKVNTYSRVKIIESSPGKVVVYWRYCPKFTGTNPLLNPGYLDYITGGQWRKDPKYANTDLVTPTAFVDEYFTITPDCNVLRTIKKGTGRFDRWEDPLNHWVQRFKLTLNGIVNVSIQKPRSSGPSQRVKGNPLKGWVPVKPCKYWKFDEGEGDITIESIDKDSCVIAGSNSYWKKGVSGNALAFDGYESHVNLPAEKAPEIKDSITLEAWIALGAYPWNWCPVVKQGVDNGYFLGVSAYGRIGFFLTINGSWQKLESEKKLKLRAWYYISGVYNKKTGRMRLYINGMQCGEKVVPATGIQTTGGPVAIGKGKDRRPVDPVRANTFIGSFSFDGLIDEVRIYDSALTSGQVSKSYRNNRPADSIVNKPDLDKRCLPEVKTGSRFGAFYTRLKYYDTWDGLWRFSGHPDVVVGFDSQPSKFIFWRGTCFIPMLVNKEGDWYSNEFNETWGTSGGHGCQEPMSDKDALTNYARIIENSPARVVVQYRYPLIDVLRVNANFNKKTGWGDWSDWYYYIYPDGVAVKRMHLWSSGKINHEWQESMAILGPLQRPEQVLETDPALILVKLDGEKAEYSWADGPPRNVRFKGTKIQVVNYKSEYDPFTIGDFKGGNVYSGEVTDYSVFPTWNHWPVSQMPSDGRYASFPDRAAHCSLTHVRLPVYREGHGSAPWQERILMEGMTNKKPEALTTLARSWLQPAGLNVISGCRTKGYEKSERAYLLAATSSPVSIEINGSVKSPILNPCFVISNWGGTRLAQLKINGKTQKTGPGFRQGVIRDVDGTMTMIIWIRYESTKTVRFDIS